MYNLQWYAAVTSNTKIFTWFTGRKGARGLDGRRIRPPVRGSGGSRGNNKAAKKCNGWRMGKKIRRVGSACFKRRSQHRWRNGKCRQIRRFWKRVRCTRRNRSRGNRAVCRYVTFYSQCGYNGKRRVIRGHKTCINFNPQAVCVPKGKKVTLYSVCGFSGKNMVITRSVSCFRTQRLRYRLIAAAKPNLRITQKAKLGKKNRAKIQN